MRCWVSKQGKKGAWSSNEFFGKIFKNEDFANATLKNNFESLEV